MHKVTAVKIDTNFMVLEVEDGVSGDLLLQRKADEVNINPESIYTNTDGRLLIRDKAEAREVIKLIEASMCHLS